MNSARCQILRLILGGASIALVTYDSPYWWVVVVPWLVLCIFGVIATIPIFCVVGLGAGGAQADWMSDEFIMGLVFVTPTILAVVISVIWRLRAMRANDQASTRNPK